MSRLTHIYEPGMTYLITTITHRRERFFEDANLARVAHEDIAFYARKFGLTSVAHVIMPDHLHWVMHPQQKTSSDSRAKNGPKAIAANIAMHPNVSISARSWKITSGTQRM